MQARRLLVLPLLISVCAALVAAQSSQNERSLVDHTDSILFTASQSTISEKLVDVVSPSEFRGRDLTAADGGGIHEWVRIAIKRIRAEHAVCCSVYAYGSDIRPLRGLFVRDHSELKHSIK